MQPQRIITDPYHINIPMIDAEFDRFELNSDLGTSLHEAEAPTFYHDALDVEE